MLETKVYDGTTEYIFIVSDGINNYEYRFTKHFINQELSEYLQNCKQEAEFLAQFEIDKNRPMQEIVL